jgi:hypothetical protein
MDDAPAIALRMSTDARPRARLGIPGQGKEEGQIALEFLGYEEIFLEVLLTLLAELCGDFRTG